MAELVQFVNDMAKFNPFVTVHLLGIFGGEEVILNKMHIAKIRRHKEYNSIIMSNGKEYMIQEDILEA